MLTKDEFKNEIKEFLYENVKDYDKDYINEDLSHREHWFDRYYNVLIANEESLDIIKDKFLLIFNTLSYDEYKEKVEFFINEWTNFKDPERVKKILEKDTNTLNEKYQQGIDKKDFFHAVREAVDIYTSVYF